MGTIRKLSLRLNHNAVLFPSTKRSFIVVSQAVNLMSEKIDELVSKVNELETSLQEKESTNDPK